jgi:hypothetical protein
MLIFKNNNINYIFIHIPKNSGKYFRKKIINDKNNKIIKSYWDINSNLDLAHIPYIKKDDFIQKDIKYTYFTFSRNPYDRIISAFFYRNPKSNKYDFKNFVKNTLTTYDFSMKFDHNIIHYYPQYLFVCNEDLNIEKNIIINKIKKPKKYILKDYFDFDNDCINIINNIYIKDFIFFDYKILDSI